MGPSVLKVLHIITGLNAGGAERSLYTLLAGGSAELNDTVVISLLDEGVYGSHIRALGVPVYTLGLKKFDLKSTLAVIQLRRLVRWFNPMVIQGWMYHGNLAASVAARALARSSPAVVWNIRQSLYALRVEKRLTRLVILANRFASPGADTIIYNSRRSHKQHESFGFSDKQGLIIPNGFDLERFRP